MQWGVFNTVMVAAIDLNADLAEGEELSASDLVVLESVTSASLACGFHAGNRVVMRATAEAALRLGVVIGAHVSYRDRDGFGRRTVAVDPVQLAHDIVRQWSTLAEEVRAAGGTVSYVKPHGALYNRMGADPVVAAAVVDAISGLDNPVLVAQPGTAVVGPALRAGIRVVAEGFPDRGYLADGALAPRDRPGALVDDPLAVADRALSFVSRGGIDAVDGTGCLSRSRPSASMETRPARARPPAGSGRCSRQGRSTSDPSWPPGRSVGRAAPCRDRAVTDRERIVTGS